MFGNDTPQEEARRMDALIHLLRGCYTRSRTGLGLMRMRVSAATLRRVERIEEARSVMRPIAEWPGIMGIEEWEAEAMQSQAELIAFTREIAAWSHVPGRSCRFTKPRRRKFAL